MVKRNKKEFKLTHLPLLSPKLNSSTTDERSVATMLNRITIDGIKNKKCHFKEAALINL